MRLPVWNAFPMFAGLAAFAGAFTMAPTSQPAPAPAMLTPTHPHRLQPLIAALTTATLMTACTLPAAPPAPLTVLGAWRIAQARSEPILDRSRARLDFGGDGRLSGHTSCNVLNGSYTQDGAAMKIGPLATTRMACPELQREQEDRILTALELVATARVRPDGLLELRDAEGRGVLRASRFEEAPESR